MAGFKRILPYAAVVLAVGCRDQGLPSEPTTGPVPPPSFAIGLGSSATFNNGIDANSTFLTMTAPAVGVDDVLLAQIGLTKNINPGDKICAPTGWNLVGVKHNFQNRYVQAIFYHVALADVNVTTLHTWHFKTSAGTCGVAGNARSGKGATGGILHFTGVDPENPIDAFASLSGSNSPAPSAPSVTTSADGAQVVRFFTAERLVTFGPAATLVYSVGSSNNSNKRTIAAFQATQTLAGPTLPFDATVSSSTEWVSATVALRPDGCDGVTGGCTQEVIDLAEGGSITLPNGDNVVVPVQTSLAMSAITITLTLQSCPDLGLDVPLYGTCLRVGAPDLPEVLDPQATVSLCSLEGGPDPPPVDLDQHPLVTLFRKDGGTYTALPHADEICPDLITRRVPEDAPLLTRLVLVVRDAVQWLLEPRPLAAAASARMRLDVGPGGFTDEFSDFQFGLPAKMAIVAATNNQSGFVGALLPSNPTVLVTDLNGDPVGGATVRFQVQTGGGSVATSTALSNGSGLAEMPWTLGPAAGSNTLQASGIGIAGPGADNVHNGPRAGVDPFIPLTINFGVGDLVNGPAVPVGTGSVTFTATGAIPPEIRVSGFAEPRNRAPLINSLGSAPTATTTGSSTIVNDLLNSIHFGSGGTVACAVDILPFVQTVTTGSLVSAGNRLVDVFFAGLTETDLGPAEATELAAFVNAGGILYVAGNSGTNEGPSHNPLFNTLGVGDQYDVTVVSTNGQSSTPASTPITGGPFGTVGALEHTPFRSISPVTLTAVATGSASAAVILAEGAFGSGRLSVMGDPLYMNLFIGGALNDPDNRKYFLNLFALGCPAP